MARIQYIPNRVIDTNGISDGANVHVYQSGTTTHVNLFSDAGFTVPIANPMVVPAGAEIPIFYTNYASPLRLRVVESSGIVSQDEDPYTSPVTNTDLSDYAVSKTALAAPSGDALVGSVFNRTARQNIFPSIWHKLPSIEVDATAGTAAQNAARIQAQIDALAANPRGGVLQLVEENISIDKPLILRPRVSVEGLGIGKSKLTNTFAGYDPSSSAIFVPGNFHPEYNGAMYGHALSKPVGVALSGDSAVTLTSPSDAGSFAAGDLITILTNEYYTTGFGHKIALYMTVRRISRISGAILYIDRPLSDGMPTGGIVHNLRTTTIQGAPAYQGGPTLPLFCWADATMAGFSCETIGNWTTGATSCYNFEWSDIEARSRRLWYANSLIHGKISRVNGGFFLKAGEMSQNCDNVVIEDCTAYWDADLAAQSAAAGFSVASLIAAGAPVGGISAQENSTYVTYRNVNITLTGLSQGTVAWVNNADNVVFDNVTARHGGAAGAFSGSVLVFGSTAIAANRRAAGKSKAINLDWSGPCGLYLLFSNVETYDCEADIRARGPVPTLISTRITDCILRNRISPQSYFENGRIEFTGTAANFEAIGFYQGGGVAALTTGGYSTLETNNIRDIRWLGSPARRAGTTSISATVNSTTTEADVISKPLGTDTLRPQDNFEFSFRASVTGTTGIKTVKAILRNTTDSIDYTVASFAVPAATTGVITGTVRVICTALNRYDVEAYCNVAAVTVTLTSITTSLAAKAVTQKITSVLASGSDAMAISTAQLKLNNAVQN